MNSVDLHCPQCQEPLVVGEICSCGLDPSLIHMTVDTARERAWVAAGFAARGDWQRAADNAEQSLRLQSSNNDLAGFVFLLARLAGTSGGPSVVSEPREDHLPAAIREFVDPVVRAIRGLKDIGNTPGLNLEEIANAFSKILPTWRSQSWGAPLRESSLGGKTQGKGSTIQRRLGALLGGMAIGATIGIGVFQVWWGNDQDPDMKVNQGNVETSAVLVDLQKEIQGLETELEELGAELNETDQRASFFTGIIEKNWISVAEILSQYPGETRPDFLGTTLPQSVGRSLYLEGLRFSRKGQYVEAEPLLDAAMIIGPRDSYYLDEAIYFRARALQRKDDLMTARETFELLIVQYPDSPYVDDAKRFLKEIQTVDSVVGKIDDR